jgi:hypothetical protein
MNGSTRWKALVIWWDKEFPAGKKLNMTVYQLANIIEDKIFELKHSTRKDKNL